LQADLKTFAAHGVYGLCAVTCVVAEHPGEVASIQAVRPAILADQIRLNLEGFPVAAVKTGMLYSAEVIGVVVEGLRLRKRRTRVVVDPVMVATSGAVLLKPGALERLCDELLPMADLITPNLDEAALLVGEPLPNVAAMREAADALRVRFGCAVLVKGGHLCGMRALDVLADAGEVLVFEAPYRKGVRTHGTGCTLSAAIAAGLAKGLAMRDAVRGGKAFVTRAIAGAKRIGRWHVLDHGA
jgi:hydroxymethylpyrimidine/phosphomethylpyrimidine kinase